MNNIKYEKNLSNKKTFWIGDTVPDEELRPLDQIENGLMLPIRLLFSLRRHNKLEIK
jgi:hypothetical protein